MKTLKQNIDELHRRLIDEANEHRDLSNQFDLMKTDLLDENLHCKKCLEDVEKELLGNFVRFVGKKTMECYICMFEVGVTDAVENCY